MEHSKLKIGLTTSAVALVCVGATYAYFRYKYRLRDAAEALKYLSIKTVTTEQACDEVVQDIRKRSKLHRAVGFDCEWVTEQGKRQPVALVQLSTFDGLCGLFRLSRLKSVPQSLKDLLEDKSIYKVGVAPHDDAKYLNIDYDVLLKSTLDIRHLAELCGHNPGGLASLSKGLLQVVLDKSWRVRCSNWAADQLTDRQMNYAAADAHVAIKMFVNLVEEYYSSSIPLLSKRNDNVWSNVDDLCWRFADLNFSSKQTAKAKVDAMQSARVSKKERASKKISTRTKPLYHNCFMQAPDGEMLCTCDNKKALWYVEKGLADIISEDPLTVRLRFEPSGRSVGEVGRYYQLTKENKCVVCGGERSYIRKNVVPREYRKYFPDIMKDHSSHDVVLLCVDCHKTSNVRDQAVRQRLAVQCNAPLVDSGDNCKYQENTDYRKLRSAARALLTQSNLPEARRSELETIVLQFYPERKEITQELLKEASDIPIAIENTDYESHGQRVVDYFLKEEGGLLRFEEIWREHFLTSMRPKYMPELWSIKHNEERLRVKHNEGRLSAEDLKVIGRWL